MGLPANPVVSRANGGLLCARVLANEMSGLKNSVAKRRKASAIIGNPLRDKHDHCRVRFTLHEFAELADIWIL